MITHYKMTGRILNTFSYFEIVNLVTLCQSALILYDISCFSAMQKYVENSFIFVFKLVSCLLMFVWLQVNGIQYTDHEIVILKLNI